MGLAVLRHVGSSQTRVKLMSPVLADRSLLLSHQGRPSYWSFTYFVRFISKYLILGGCYYRWYYIFNFNFHLFIACICYSVAQSCPTLYKPIDCSTPGFPVLHHLPELVRFMSIELMMPSSHLILCHPLLLLPSVFPSIRFFSNELALCIRWPKFWSFSFSISPSNEYSGLISSRIYWFDLLAVQGTLKSLLKHHSSKASIFHSSALFMV